MTPTNDKIKLPVRIDPTNKYRINDANGRYVITCNYPGTRPDAIHKLNGYDVAVKALRDIYSDGGGWGQRLAWYALSNLGELNGGANQGPETACEGQAGRTSTVGGTTTPESPRREGSGQGAASTQQRDRDAECNDAGNDSVCALDDCDDPVGVDPGLCPFHEKMVYDTQEADSGK